MSGIADWQNWGPDWGPDKPAQILAFCGYAGAGKDAAAALVGWPVRAWAEPVYAAALALDPWLSTAGCSLATLVLRRGWEKAKRTYPEVREFLQRVGVEAGRNIHGDDCWVKLTDLTGPVSIVGTRFVNEIQAVWRAKGSVVWVTRPGIEAANDHASEHQLGPHCADYVLRNDGTLEDLAESVQTMLEVLGLVRNLPQTSDIPLQG